MERDLAARNTVPVDCGDFFVFVPPASSARTIWEGRLKGGTEEHIWFYMATDLEELLQITNRTLKGDSDPLMMATWREAHALVVALAKRCHRMIMRYDRLARCPYVTVLFAPNEASLSPAPDPSLATT